MLRRRNLVMLGLGGYAQLPQFSIQFRHERRDPVLDVAEVMVFQFLSLGRFGTEQGPAGKNQIFAQVEHLFVDEEILLLGADGGGDPLDRFIAKNSKYPECMTVQSVH